jgi:hypothetical protein
VALGAGAGARSGEAAAGASPAATAHMGGRERGPTEREEALGCAAGVK